MSKSNIFLFIAIFLLVGVLAVIPQYFEKTSFSSNIKLPNPLQRKILPSPPIAAHLSLLPNNMVITPGKPASVAIVITSENEFPSLIQFEIAYDPSTLTGMTISAGDYFTNPNILLQSINENSGRISYAIEAPPNQKKKGGTVATLNFTSSPSINRGETTVSFLPKTVIRTSENKDILQGKNSTTITIQASPSAKATY